LPDLGRKGFLGGLEGYLLFPDFLLNVFPPEDFLPEDFLLKEFAINFVLLKGSGGSISSSEFNNKN